MVHDGLKATNPKTTQLFYDVSQRMFNDSSGNYTLVEEGFAVERLICCIILLHDYPNDLSLTIQGW